MKYACYILLALFITNTSFSQVTNDKVDIGELMTDLVLTKKSGNNIKQVLLLPPDYWEIVLSDSRFKGGSIVEEVKEMFDGFILVACIDAEVGLYGSFVGNEIAIQLMDAEGGKHDPIPDEELSEELGGMISVFKPIMSRMLGQMGEQLRFYIFKNTDINGNEILAPRNKGNFALFLNESKFAFRTPFGAMVEKKTCPETGEKLNGNWDFCPWHGTKLLHKN